MKQNQKYFFKNLGRSQVIAILFFLGLAGTTEVVEAQHNRKMVTPATSYPSYSGSGHSEQEVTVQMGMEKGAINLGAAYIRPLSDFGLGGYFFMQTGKDKNSTTTVSQVTALGALIKVTIMDSSTFRFYLAPGFGVMMIKDGSIGANNGKSDETVFSPNYRMGLQFKLSPDFVVGIERTQFSNWFNENLNNYQGPADYFQVAGTFGF